MNHTECLTEIFGALLIALEQFFWCSWQFTWLLNTVTKALSLSLSALKPILTHTSGPTQLLVWSAFWTFNIGVFCKVIYSRLCYAWNKAKCFQISSDFEKLSQAFHHCWQVLFLAYLRQKYGSQGNRAVASPLSLQREAAYCSYNLL